MPIVAVGDDKIGAISRQLARQEEPELSIIKDIIAGMRPEFFAAQLRPSSSAEKPIPVRIERNKLAGLIEENWKKIHQEVKQIAEGV